MIRDKENPRVLHSAGELREMFAPVESAEEALSCAMAAAGSCVSFDGRYGHAAPDEYRNFVKHIEDAHVEAAEGGYAVNLFPQQGCG